MKFWTTSFGHRISQRPPTQTKPREQIKPSKANLSPLPVQEGPWTGTLRKRQLGAADLTRGKCTELTQ